jgi:hypothetical protein
LLNDEVRPQKVVVEAPFVYNSRYKSNQRASGGSSLLIGNNKSLGSNSRSSIKSQLSLQTNTSLDWDDKVKKKPRQLSHTFGSRNNVMTTISLPRKPGRPKRDVNKIFSLIYINICFDLLAIGLPFIKSSISIIG